MASAVGVPSWFGRERLSQGHAIMPLGATARELMDSHGWRSLSHYDFGGLELVLLQDFKIEVSFGILYLKDISHLSADI